MPLSSGRYIGLYFTIFQCFYICLREVSVVQRCRLGFAQLLGDGIYSWDRFCLVIGVIGDCVGNYQPTFLVYRNLCIVMLVKIPRWRCSS
jgi:hypothetical protein